MHYIDIVILVIVIASAVEGAIQGFIYEICSLLGLIAGFFLALEFSATAAGYLSFIPLEDWILRIIAFLLILIAVNVILRLLGKSLRAILRKVFMGWMDRMLGALFGLLRGSAFVVFLVAILLLTPLQEYLLDQTVETSLLSPAVFLARFFLGLLIGNKPPALEPI
jgi:membrane protein required for colicin V production